LIFSVLKPSRRAVNKERQNLAVLFKSQGRYAEAEALYQRSLAVPEKPLGPSRPKVAACRENYALLLRELARAGARTRSKRTVN
jgi:hypothetical protein